MDKMHQIMIKFNWTNEQTNGFEEESNSPKLHWNSSIHQRNTHILLFLQQQMFAYLLNWTFLFVLARNERKKKRCEFINCSNETVYQCRWNNAQIAQDILIMMNSRRKWSAVSEELKKFSVNELWVSSSHWLPTPLKFHSVGWDGGPN